MCKLTVVYLMLYCFFLIVYSTNAKCQFDQPSEKIRIKISNEALPFSWEDSPKPRPSDLEYSCTLITHARAEGCHEIC